jgi:predicted dehydrogenase
MAVTNAPLRWGIASTGSIAETMAAALAAVPDAELAAVCSRTQDAAERFAGQHGARRAHGSYEALAENPEVDVVYVATPNHRHHPDTLMYLDAGKHVVCEKPLALNAAEVEEMVTTAKRSGRFLMEAMWSRFLPSYRRLVEIVSEGQIGEVVQVDASFGFTMPFAPDHRVFDLAKGGGSLLDLGVYAVNLSHLLLGAPTTVEARAHIGSTGVDEQTIALLSFPGGALATASSAIRAHLPCDARIVGTAGMIGVPAFMHCAESLEVHRHGSVERIDLPMGPTPFQYQVAEVGDCIRQGLDESPTMPLQASLDLARVLDAVRDRIGLRYPGE